MIHEQDNLIRRFLLGELPEDQRIQLEERMFKEDAFFEDVRAIEEELADECVNRELAGQERSEVENFFTRSRRRREQLQFAAALGTAMRETTPSAVVASQKKDWLAPVLNLFRPSWALAATAAAALLVVLSAWLWIQNSRLSRNAEVARRESESIVQSTAASRNEAEQKALDLEKQIASLRSEGGDLRAKIAEKEKELETLRRSIDRPTSSSAQTVAFILSPGLTRGNDEPEKVVIPSSATNVRLQLDVERLRSYQGYLAEIRTARGNLVWSMSGLSKHKTSYGQAILLPVPASVLLNGEYEVTLKGTYRRDVQTLGYYYLIVLHRQ